MRAPRVRTAGKSRLASSNSKTLLRSASVRGTPMTVPPTFGRAASARTAPVATSRRHQYTTFRCAPYAQARAPPLRSRNRGHAGHAPGHRRRVGPEGGEWRGLRASAIFPPRFQNGGCRALRVRLQIALAAALGAAIALASCDDTQQYVEPQRVAELFADLTNVDFNGQQQQVYHVNVLPEPEI